MKKLKLLGPGLLYAGAAIGVSHIVQSTKAGAQYGYALLGFILLVHLLKYPFFQLGAKYAAETGNSLLEGYLKIGKWALLLMILVSLSTTFFIQSAVTIVTSGIAAHVFNLDQPLWFVSMIVLLICTVILLLNRLDILQNLMKVIMLILSISTIVAVVLSFDLNSQGTQDAVVFTLENPKHVLFLIAFLGWMPAPLDISIWQSIRKSEDMKLRKESKGTMFDFNVGFWGTAFLACGFLILGANTLYGSGAVLPVKGAEFAGMLIQIYSEALGEWAFYIIAIAALFTMFSTTLTCLDAVPRLLSRSGALLGFKSSKSTYVVSVTCLALGSVLILKYFVSSMIQMVDFATSVSFLTAPVIAILGMVIVKKHMPKGFWSPWVWALAILGVTLLVVFSLSYMQLSL